MKNSSGDRTYSCLISSTNFPDILHSAAAEAQRSLRWGCPFLHYEGFSWTRMTFYKELQADSCNKSVSFGEFLCTPNMDQHSKLLNIKLVLCGWRKHELAHDYLGGLHSGTFSIPDRGSEGRVILFQDIQVIPGPLATLHIYIYKKTHVPVQETNTLCYQSRLVVK